MDLCGQGEVPVVVRLKLCKNAVAFQEGGDGEDARLHVVTSVRAYDNSKMIVLRNGCGIAQSVPIPVAAQCIDIVKLAPIDVGGGKPAIAVDRPFAAFGDQLFRIGIGDCLKELFVIGYGALMAGRDAFLGTLCVVKWQIPVISLLQSSQFIIRRGHCVIRLRIDQRAILLIVGDVFSVALLHDKARNEVCSVQVIQPLVVCKEHAAIAVCLDDVDFGIKGVFVGNVPITAKKIIDGYGVQIGIISLIGVWDMQPQKEKQHGNACSKQNAANDNKGNEQGTTMVFYHINLTNNYQGYLSIAYKLKKCKTGKEIAFSEQQIACFSRAFSCIMYL